MIVTGLLLLAAIITIIVALTSHGGGNIEPDGPPHCIVDHCAQTYVPEGAKSCSEAVCRRCKDDYDQHLDACIYRCSTGQRKSGCSPLGCLSDGSCRSCVPGFTVKKLGENFRGPAYSCAKAAKPVKMNFFMYRAQNDDNYLPANTVLASPAGVMWYLHNEVVDSCPGGSRRFGIARVLRYNITVHNPAAVFTKIKGQFGHFVDFKWGECRNPDCDRWWKEFGYAVGCQNQNSHHYKQATFYSLPGPCPSKALDSKSDVCNFQQPGGFCSHPDGTGNCTWSAELAGNVSVDELSGIHDIRAFCAAGKAEYSSKTDKGNGTNFWDERMNATRNDERVSELLKLFALHYPEVDVLSMPPPICDGL